MSHYFFLYRIWAYPRAPIPYAAQSECARTNFDLLPPILPATTACLEACGGTFDCLL